MKQLYNVFSNEKVSTLWTQLTWSHLRLKNEEKQIPTNIDYDKIPNLASEARQKLKEVRPLNIAQAIRISGVNPADISILLVYLRKQYNE